MSTESHHVASLALRLPPSERAALAAQLIASLDEETDDDAEALWEGEIQRRVREVEAGQVTLIPWEEVRASISTPNP